MTAQIPDLFRHRDNTYNVVGVNGKGLLLPQDFDVSPTGFSTACLRGYYLEYACFEENLILAALSLRIGKNDRLKDIQGISPVGDKDQFFIPSSGRFYMRKYHNLKVPILYSGGFLVAKDFVKEIGVEEIPQSYETVIEFLFDNGKLVKVIEWSELVAREREETLANKPNKPSYVVEFSLKYDSLYFYHMEQYAR